MFVEVILGDQSEASVNRFERSVRLYPDVVDCHATTGSSDHLIVVALASFVDVTRLRGEVDTRLPGAKKIKSVFSLRRIRPAMAMAGGHRHDGAFQN